MQAKRERTGSKGKDIGYLLIGLFCVVEEL